MVCLSEIQSCYFEVVAGGITVKSPYMLKLLVCCY